MGLQKSSEKEEGSARAWQLIAAPGVRMSGWAPSSWKFYRKKKGC